MMLEKVLPAIKSKWPQGYREKDIIIQEDNAKPHHARIRAAVEKAAKDDEWNVVVKPQPPNSPDFNVNDLGFFNSIQNLQHKQAAKNIDEMIAAVDNDFHDAKRDTMDDVFLTLQGVMQESLTVAGDNTYKLPHMGKNKPCREGSFQFLLPAIPISLPQAGRF